VPSAIWTGSISFGLVTVPVRMISATRSLDVRFHQLEEGTGSRIRYKRVSEQSGDEVPNDRIVKGYELEPGRYVVIEADELASLKPKASRQIEIEDFVDLADIDPVFFEQPYYLIPDKENAKAYRLLVDVMEDLGKVAIGRFVLRSKEALVAIRPLDGVLVLETMRFADEVLAADREQPLAEAASEPTEREKDMAKQLVNSLTAEFDPEKYHDEYREELLALIDKKASGEEIVAAPEAEEPAKVLDLMAALEASLARAGAKQAKSEKPAPAKKAASNTAKPAKRAAPAKKAAAKKASARKVAAKRTRKSA
jgi:DNA end-binding protein Ku